MSQPEPWDPPQSPPSKPDPRLILAILLLTVIVLVAVLAVTSLHDIATSNASNLGSPSSINIVGGLITVPAGGINYYPFTFGPNATNVRIRGTFTVSGGKSIQVLVLDQANYDRMQNHQQYTFFYNSGQATGGSIDTGLNSDQTYDLIYSNGLSTSNTDIQTKVDLYYVCTCRVR